LRITQELTNNTVNTMKFDNVFDLIFTIVII